MIRFPSKISIPYKVDRSVFKAMVNYDVVTSWLACSGQPSGLIERYRVLIPECHAVVPYLLRLIVHMF